MGPLIGLVTLLLLKINVDATLSDKPPCTFYFGQDVTKSYTTVVDVDVPNGFPTANLTFIHHSGPGSECLSPAPPKGCHRYYRVDYTEDCKPLGDGSLVDLAGNIDSQGIFDRASGVLKGCETSVKNFQKYCFGPPTDSPEQCACE
eukprot:jgi/Bigna1/84802/estExt_fgenesh1_pg.C_10089